MKNLAVAIYARVSSDQQAQAQTIASQVAALRARVTADDCVVLPECEFIDEGYSGATLVRPGLEHLRDLGANGGSRAALCPFPRSLSPQVCLSSPLDR